MRKLYQQQTWFFLLLCIGMAGCAGTNPIKAAETTQQRAYASYGTFVIAQEKAADVVEQTSLPNSVKLRIIRAEERAKPVADRGPALIEAVDTAVTEAREGETTEDRVVNVTTNLNRWINDIVPLVNDLLTTIRGAE